MMIYLLKIMIFHSYVKWSLPRMDGECSFQKHMTIIIVHPPLYIYVYMYIGIYAYMFICLYVYMFICLYVLYMYICICVYMNMYICIYVYMYVYIFMYHMSTGVSQAFPIIFQSEILWVPRPRIANGPAGSWCPLHSRPQRRLRC